MEASFDKFKGERSMDDQKKPAKYAAKYIRIFDKNENYLTIITNVARPYSEHENPEVRQFLSEVYSAAVNSKQFAICTIYKAILNHRKAFVALTLKALKDAINADVDNKKPAEPRLKQFATLLSQVGIVQLWDSQKGVHKAGGYAVNDPDLLDLLELTNEELRNQYEGLKAFCSNGTIDDSLVFNDSGEMSIKTDEIRKGIEANRVKREAKKNNKVVDETTSAGATSDEASKNKITASPILLDDALSVSSTVLTNPTTSNNVIATISRKDDQANEPEVKYKRSRDYFTKNKDIYVKNLNKSGIEKVKSQLRYCILEQLGSNNDFDRIKKSNIDSIVQRIADYLILDSQDPASTTEKIYNVFDELEF